jgi:hypothetical protein
MKLIDYASSNEIFHPLQVYGLWKNQHSMDVFSSLISHTNREVCEEQMRTLLAFGKNLKITAINDEANRAKCEPV